MQTTGSIALGVVGNFASWTTNLTTVAVPASVTSGFTMTLSGLGALVPGGTVTTTAQTIQNAAGGATQASINTQMAAALTAALNSAGASGSTVTATTNVGAGYIDIVLSGSVLVAGGTPTITYTYSGVVGFPANSSFSVPNNTNTLAAWVTAFQSGATGNANFTKSNITNGVRFTATAAGTLGTLGLTQTNSTATVTFPTTTRTTTQGPNTLTMTFSITPTTTAVTPVPVLTSNNTAIIAVGTNGTVTPSTASTMGTTNYQSLTYGTLTGLPASGIISNAGALLGGSWAVTVGTTAMGPVIWSNTAMSGNQTINLPNTNTNIQYVLDTFPDNTVLTINGPAGTTGNMTRGLVGCSFSASKTITINYVRGAGSTDNLQIALSCGTPLASVIAGTNSSIVNAVNISLDATSYGGRLMLVDASGNVLSNTVLNSTGSTQQILYVGTAN